MKIHSNVLTREDIIHAARNIAHCDITDLSERGSRSHKNRWDIKLSGDSLYNQNFGDSKAATWDQWGIFLAYLFRLDPTVKTDMYSDVNNFHWITGERFISLTYPEQHKRHKWIPIGNDEFICDDCDSSMRNNFCTMPVGYVAPNYIALERV